MLFDCAPADELAMAGMAARQARLIRPSPVLDRTCRGRAHKTTPGLRPTKQHGGNVSDALAPLQKPVMPDKHANGWLGNVPLPKDTAQRCDHSSM
jgi:hypothetical protein